MEPPKAKLITHWFHQLARGEIEADEYEPLCLWLIPIFLRPRRKYYSDAIKDTRKLIEWYWENSKSIYGSRAAFESSDLIRQVWERGAPAWWGLNDVIGWIDVRLCVRRREFHLSLFLPTKQISRRLKNKIYKGESFEVISIPDPSTNKKLRSTLIHSVERLASDARLKRRYIDLVSWRRLVRSMDLVGLIRETAKEDMEMLSKKHK